jgi:hypothetical protein
MARKKVETKKTNAEKLARQAGKVAAKAERSATEAVDRAKALSAFFAEFFGKPIGAAVHAGQERIGQLSAGVTNLFTSETGSGSSDGAIEAVKGAVESRMRAIVHELGLPTRDEYEALKARLAELEAAAAKKPARTRALPAKGVAKPAAKPAAKAARKAGAEASKSAAVAAPKRAVRAPR